MKRLSLVGLCLLALIGLSTFDRYDVNAECGTGINPEGKEAQALVLSIRDNLLGHNEEYIYIIRPYNHPVIGGYFEFAMVPTDGVIEDPGLYPTTYYPPTPNTPASTTQQIIQFRKGNLAGISITNSNGVLRAFGCNILK